MAGKTDHELFPGEIAERFQADDEEVFSSRETLKFVEEVPTPDGPKPHLTIKRPIYDETGDLYGLCAGSMNVSRFEDIGHG